jgi:hypothetical protein
MNEKSNFGEVYPYKDIQNPVYYFQSIGFVYDPVRDRLYPAPEIETNYLPNENVTVVLNFCPEETGVGRDDFSRVYDSLVERLSGKEFKVFLKLLAQRDEKI